MKTHPMIFNQDMVQALLDGRKVQTRRPFTKSNKKLFSYAAMAGECSYFIDGNPLQENDYSYVLQFAPVQMDDLIYVRETFNVAFNYPDLECEYVINFLADNRVRPVHPTIETNDYLANAVNKSKNTPSIHMPRWASRLTLRVTAVRVERIQDITEEDAKKEGFTGGHGSIEGYMYSATVKEHFFDVWESIYKGSMERNDWVWVIDFDVIKQNIDQYIFEEAAA